MKISVIIPTHNRAAYLKLAVDSVLKQTYKTFEIIIIDDQSTDNTKEVIDSYNLDCIKYIYTEKAGPGKARNLGVKNMSGDFVAFLDSDDLWAPDKLESQIKVFKKEPGIGVVVSDFKIIDGQGHVVKESAVGQKYSYEGFFLRDFLDGKLPIATDTVMARREVFDKVGFFDEQQIIAEDLDMWIRMAVNFKMGYIHRPLTFVRTHSGNVSGISKMNTWLAAVLMIQRNDKNIRMQGLSPEKYENKFLVLAGNAALKEDKYEEARSLFIRAAKVYWLDINSYKGILKYYLKSLLNKAGTNEV